MPDPDKKHVCPMCNGLGYIFKKWSVLRAKMGWDESVKTRPLVFNDRETGGLRDNVADCENSRSFFIYEPGFSGWKKRDIFVVDMDEA